MMKVLIGLIIFLAVIFLVVFIFYYFGFSIGQQCGHWDAFGGIQKECNCIGIKTRPCPPIAACDGGVYRCIGICQNCVCSQFNHDTNKVEIISCD